MMWLWVVLIAVAAQRVWELRIADRNTRRLVAEGGVEIGAAHYPLFIALHASWLAAIAIVTPWTMVPNLWWLALYAVLQFGRLWVILTLGRFWTTRIITVPDAPLVRRGPYRFMRHPNYVVASLEIAVLPLAFGQPWIALVWSVANALLLAWRIRMEDRVLNERR
jgi:methyltransferase